MERRRFSPRVQGPALVPLVRPAHWLRAGLSPRQERVFNWLTGGMAALLLAAWAASVCGAYVKEGGDPGAQAVGPARQMAAALADPRSRTTAYLDDAQLRFLAPLRGQSGKLKAVFRSAGDALSAMKPDPALRSSYEDEEGHQVTAPQSFAAPNEPGVYKLAVEFGKARQAIDGLRVVTLVPFGEKKNDRIGLYYLGSWPYESGGMPRSKAYANPTGFVEVTPENKATHVSEHFRLQDFLTKDQRDVWPKYVLIDTRLLDKLELTIQTLEAAGHPVRHLAVMSGFRTPQYNKGGGNTGGRANLSRHMYGDAADVFVDNDGNGTMDDLNRDGKVDPADAEVIGRAVEEVEARYPALVGGVGIYPACCGHGPFTHVDTRGYRARWRGTGSG
jgi:uncharacterized protein YcbK (DUF882 family)